MDAPAALAAASAGRPKSCWSGTPVFPQEVLGPVGRNLSVLPGKRRGSRRAGAMHRSMGQVFEVTESVRTVWPRIQASGTKGEVGTPSPQSQELQGHPSAHRWGEGGPFGAPSPRGSIVGHGPFRTPDPFHEGRLGTCEERVQ